MESDWEQRSAKPGFIVVIVHLSYTFEQNDEARKEIYLVKFQLGNQKHIEQKSTNAAW